MGRATGETHHPAPHPPQRFSNPPTQHSPATARIRRLLMGFACGSTHPTLLQREGAEGEQRTVENDWFPNGHGGTRRSEEHTSELQSLMRNSYAVFCLKKKKQLI